MNHYATLIDAGGYGRGFKEVCEVIECDGFDHVEVSFSVLLIVNAAALLAALAEQEREFISQRTKAALAAAKERGVKLGGLRDKTGARNRAKSDEAQLHAEKLRQIVTPLCETRKTTRQIAAALNAAGQRTARGFEYQSAQVSRLVKRLGL